MRWNPEKKMIKKVTSKLMKAGCAAYDPALLHTEHVHPLERGVYASGVYKANRNALFCCKKPGLIEAVGPLSSHIVNVYVACANGLFGFAC